MGKDTLVFHPPPPQIKASLSKERREHRLQQKTRPLVHLCVSPVSEDFYPYCQWRGWGGPTGLPFPHNPHPCTLQRPCSALHCVCYC